MPAKKLIMKKKKKAGESLIGKNKAKRKTKSPDKTKSASSKKKMKTGKSMIGGNKSKDKSMLSKKKAKIGKSLLGTVKAKSLISGLKKKKKGKKMLLSGPCSSNSSSDGPKTKSKSKKSKKLLIGKAKLLAADSADSSSSIGSNSADKTKSVEVDKVNDAPESKKKSKRRTTAFAIARTSSKTATDIKVDDTSPKVTNEQIKVTNERIEELIKLTQNQQNEINLLKENPVSDEQLRELLEETKNLKDTMKSAEDNKIEEHKKLMKMMSDHQHQINSLYGKEPWTKGRMKAIKAEKNEIDKMEKDLDIQKEAVAQKQNDLKSTETYKMRQDTMKQKRELQAERCKIKTFREELKAMKVLLEHQRILEKNRQFNEQRKKKQREEMENEENEVMKLQKELAFIEREIENERNKEVAGGYRISHGQNKGLSDFEMFKNCKNYENAIWIAPNQDREKYEKYEILSMVYQILKQADNVDIDLDICDVETKKIGTNGQFGVIVMTKDYEAFYRVFSALLFGKESNRNAMKWMNIAKYDGLKSHREQVKCHDKYNKTRKYKEEHRRKLKEHVQRQLEEI